MTHMIERDPDLEVGQLRALLTMSRELMQSDKPFAALAPAGRAMVELAHVDSALLLVRGEVNECILSTRRAYPPGRLPATSGTPWPWPGSTAQWTSLR